MRTCPDCGCRVYNLGCVNCNEVAYIEEQAALDEFWPDPARVGSSEEGKALGSAKENE